MDLKIRTNNCNGLNIPTRFCILATEINKILPDICFIQETHLTDLPYAKILLKQSFT